MKKSSNLTKQFFSQIEDRNQRLDKFISRNLVDYSRAKIQQWICDGFVSIDDKIVTQSNQKLSSCQKIDINAEIKPKIIDQGEPIKLNIVYEDEHILVINKPNNIVVHPGAGNSNNTILNGLLHYLPEINKIPRAGIVHRLDKNTTGLMVVAKTLPAQTKLAQDIADRKINRNYKAIVYGNLISGSTIETQMGRHLTQRTKMAVVDENKGKEAITHYRIIKKFRSHTYLNIKLETGRTHQIRVHMQHIGHPIIGDKTYFGKPRFNKKADVKLNECLQKFDRQALHAFGLQLNHPITNEQLSWTIPVPQDMENLINLLEEDNNAHNTKME